MSLGVIITGGYDSLDVTKEAEVWSPQGLFHCPLPNMNQIRFGHTQNGLLGNGLKYSYTHSKIFDFNDVASFNFHILV